MLSKFGHAALVRKQPRGLLLYECQVNLLEVRFCSDTFLNNKGVPFCNKFLLVWMQVAVVSDNVPMLLKEPGYANLRWVDARTRFQNLLAKWIVDWLLVVRDEKFCVPRFWWYYGLL